MPAPLYAVAGVGELAYRRLRRLPTDIERLPLLAAALRTEIPAAVGTVVARAQDVYHELVARGEAAVASPRTSGDAAGPVTRPTATKPTATKPTATKPTATKPTATKPASTRPARNLRRVTK